MTDAHDSRQDAQDGREQHVTDQVLASFADATTPRFRELMESLVRHAHAFVRDVRLTEPEWEAGDRLPQAGR